MWGLLVGESLSTWLVRAGWLPGRTAVTRTVARYASFSEVSATMTPRPLPADEVASLDQSVDGPAYGRGRGAVLRLGHDLPVPSREVLLARVDQPDPGEALPNRLVVNRDHVIHVPTVDQVAARAANGGTTMLLVQRSPGELVAPLLLVGLGVLEVGPVILDPPLYVFGPPDPPDRQDGCGIGKGLRVGDLVDARTGDAKHFLYLLACHQPKLSHPATVEASELNTVLGVGE